MGVPALAHQTRPAQHGELLRQAPAVDRDASEQLTRGVVTLSEQTLVDILARTVSPQDALRAGRLTLDGPPEVFARSLAILAAGLDSAT